MILFFPRKKARKRRPDPMVQDKFQIEKFTWCVGPIVKTARVGHKERL